MNAPGQRRFRNILLTGLPGVGKSTFGKAYAQMSRTEFVELDKYVERLAGKPIAEIFAQDGEQVFRELEAQCLERLLKRQRCTIALGGGTLTNPRSFELAQELGCLVWLTAPVEVITERLWPQKDARPLLTDCSSKEQLCARLEVLLADRLAQYEVADVVLDTNYSSVDALKIELSWMERCLFSRSRNSLSEAADVGSNTVPVSNRRIPYADPSYRSPREKKSGPEIVDKMDRLIKAQRQKERAEKSSRVEKNAKSEQHPPESMPNPRQRQRGAIEGASTGQGPVPKTRQEAPKGSQRAGSREHDRQHNPRGNSRGPTSANSPLPIPANSPLPIPASVATPRPRPQAPRPVANNTRNSPPIEAGPQPKEKVLVNSEE